MAGNNNRPGRSAGGTKGGAAAPASKTIAIKPAMSLDDRKLVKSIATTRKAIAYERKNGAVTEDRIIQTLQGRLNDQTARALKQSAAKTGGKSGIRLSFRSKGDAARNYRARAGQTSYVANNAHPLRGRNTSIQGVRVGNGQLARRATAPQGNFLTGGTDKISGRLQPAGQRRVRRRSKPY